MRNEQAQRELAAMEDQNSKEDLISRIDELPPELAERSAGCRIKRFAEDVGYTANATSPTHEAQQSVCQRRQTIWYLVLRGAAAE